MLLDDHLLPQSKHLIQMTRGIKIVDIYDLTWEWNDLVFCDTLVSLFITSLSFPTWNTWPSISLSQVKNETKFSYSTLKVNSTYFVVRCTLGRQARCSLFTAAVDDASSLLVTSTATN